MDVLIVENRVILLRIAELQGTTPDQRLFAITVVNEVTWPRIVERQMVELMDRQDKLV